MFDPIRKVTKNMQSITAERVLSLLIEGDELKDLIIELNTDAQLFQKGIDSQGQSLGEYAESTKLLKRSEGLPFDRVTLYQEGDFYKTWRVFMRNGNIAIEADGDKDDKNLFDVYGEDVVGLTEENLQIVIDEIKNDTPELVKELLFA